MSHQHWLKSALKGSHFRFPRSAENLLSMFITSGMRRSWSDCIDAPSQCWSLSVDLKLTATVFMFFFSFTVLQNYFTYFLLRQSERWATGLAEENSLITWKQKNFACLIHSPGRTQTPQVKDESQRFQPHEHGDRWLCHFSLFLIQTFKTLALKIHFTWNITVFIA